MNESTIQQNNATFAEFIRIITLPATLVLAMIIVLAESPSAIFLNGWDTAIGIFALVIFPILAYPLQPLIPSLKNQGRKGQRTLAFITSIIGYIIGVLYAFIARRSQSYKFIMLSYLIAVVILAIFNKLIKIRASGHACGITGPLLFLTFFKGRAWFVICLLVMAVSFWASLYLKRHKPKDLFYGAITCVVGFVISLFITML